MPIFAIALTTVECDGAPCPSNTVVEYPHPQSVAIRLARQSGWTVWIETMCPECTGALAPVAAPEKPAPVVLTPDAGCVVMVLAAAN